MQAVMVKMRVQWDQEVFDTCVLQDNVSESLIPVYCKTMCLI
jgi:hypothetical protein